MPAPGLPVAAALAAEVDPAGRGRAGAAVAALTAFGLGVLAAVMMVAGHAPWEGPEVLSLSQTHGLHRGDVFALVPVAIGIALAAWCLAQPRRSG